MIRSLVVVLLLLASVGTASAGCAWVVWLEQTLVAPNGIIQGTRWSPIGGYPLAAECMKALPEDSRESRADGNPGALAKQYRCFPDTVDPRGPKGKSVGARGATIRRGPTRP
jgi:hypothetical protein